MPYTFFQQCYKVLDMYKIPALTLDKRRLQMKTEWYKTPIDFSDSVSQCAYIRTDVPYHANVLLKIIEEHLELSDLFEEGEQQTAGIDDEENDEETENREELNVISIGCGPGTDMIALFKYIVNEGNFGNKKLNILLTDDEPAWEKITDQFEMLIHKFQEKRAKKINFFKEFQAWKILDVEIPMPQIVWDRLKNTHLFIFNLFFSNLAQQNDNTWKLCAAIFHLCKMLNRAMKDAIFLFIDIDRDDAKMFRRACLKLAGFVDGAVKNIGQDSKGFKMPREEQKTDLREYYSSKCQPKLRHDKKMDFVIYQKL